MTASTAQVAADTRRERVILLVLAAVQFTNIVDFMILMPLGPQLFRTMGINERQFGGVVSAYTFSACLAGLAAALFVDRFDRKRSFLVAYAGFLVGTACCGLVNGYLPLLAARVFTGAFGGVIGGMAMAIIGDVFPENRRGAATGALMSAFALASVAGVPAGLYLGTKYDWHAPFLALTALATLILPAAVWALPNLRTHLDAVARETDSPLRRLATTIIEPDHLRAFALIITLMLGGFLVIPFISPYYVANVGLREADLPAIYAAGGFLTLFAAPLIGRLADHYGKLRVYLIVAPVAGVMMVIITNLPRVPVWVAVAAFAGLMVGNAGRMVVAMAMVTSCVEPRRRGGFMSVNAAVQHLATGLGAFLGGLIVRRAADGTFLHFDRVGYLALTSTVASLFLARRLRSYAPSIPVADCVAADLDGPTAVPLAGLVD